MRMQRINFPLSMIICILASGCVPVAGESTMGTSAVTAIEKSLAYADRDRVDANVYMVRSVSINSNGRTSVIKMEASNEYEVSVIRNLYGKRYWEVCYGTAMPGLAGATYCYYFDRSDYKFLAEYKVK